MIIPVWKPIGASTHQLAELVGQLASRVTQNIQDRKATHTGTLDPMAEGVVVVLTGKDRFQKKKYSQTKKSYKFSILFGVETDSLDTLGLQTNVILKEIDQKKLSKQIQNILPTFIGDQLQVQPRFSAQRINGNSGFDLAKKGDDFQLKENKIRIYNLQIDSEKAIPIPKIETEIINNIQKVSGDFRQKQISQNWKKTFTDLQKIGISQLLVLTCTATVSKRTYIRALTRDISQLLQIPATTFSITRTQNGDYSKHDCISMTPEIFAKQIQTLQNQDSN